MPGKLWASPDGGQLTLAANSSFYSHLDCQLIEIEKVIEKMMRTDLLKYATSDLNRPLAEGPGVTNEVPDWFIPLFAFTTHQLDR